MLGYAVRSFNNIMNTGICLVTRFSNVLCPLVILRMEKTMVAKVNVHYYT